ncbi:CD209 antigen-like protein E isoform X1 [Scleropages formosus]|uniref:CD209 antigen-like protein E isoform X1 n=1 Tax=Scleropages formosus TaxID=113540 RepID=UPI0010FA991D|nr:CD209 antigen-like protein E isoform X1 [Scleropages formosus]
MDKQEGMYTTLIQDESSAEVPTHNLNIEGNNYLSMSKGSAEHKARRYQIATGILGLLCAILMIAIITLCVRYKGEVLPSAELESLRANYSKLEAAMNELHLDRHDAIDTVVGMERRWHIYTEEIEELRREKENLQEEKRKLQLRITEQDRSCEMCPVGWRLFSSRCYFFSASEGTRRKSWPDARADCVDRGADLVEVESKEKQTYLSRVIEGIELRDPHVWHLTGFWMGLRDIHTEGVWKWLNGTELTVGYWMDGEPNDQYSTEDCAATYLKPNPLKSWNDAPCSTKLYWICEKGQKKP